MHGLSVCERLRQFRKLFALLVLEIYANYVDRWRGSDRTRESLAKAKTVCRGRKLHARNRLTAAVNDSTFKYIYIYIFFSRFISLLLYRREKNILFLPNVETFEKKNKFRWFAFTRTIFSHFFPFNIYSLSQLCHYIVCSNALRSVCVSHRECVWFISFYSVYLLHFFPLFLRGTGCAGEEVSIVFLRVESLLLVTTSKEVCCRHGLQENFPRFFFPPNFDPPFEEREKEPRFTSSRTSALPLIRVSGKRSFWVY